MESQTSPRPAIALAVLSNMTAVTEIIAEGLPDELHEAVRSAGAAWRDPRQAIKRLEEIKKAHNLPGLAIWYVQKKDVPTLPPPVDLPFEPLELDEARSPLQDLVAGDTDQEVHRAHTVRRGLIRIGLPMAVILPQLINAGIQLMVNPTTFTFLLWALIIGIITGVFFLMWWMAPEWYVVPGGVVVRRAGFKRLGEKLELYTPRDTLLVVRMNPPGYAVELWGKERSRVRKATLLETRTVLGIWQSDREPPTLEKLSDLIITPSRD